MYRLTWRLGRRHGIDVYEVGVVSRRVGEFTRLATFLSEQAARQHIQRTLTQLRGRYENH